MDTASHDIVFSGANLYIQSGLGTTGDTSTGLGILIIGYDESSSSTTKTGAHNLVLGMYNSYTSYSGMLTGVYNEISGACSIAAGKENTASGISTVVMSGQKNTAPGQ